MNNFNFNLIMPSKAKTYCKSKQIKIGTFFNVNENFRIHYF